MMKHGEKLQQEICKIWEAGEIYEQRDFAHVR